MDPDPGGPKHTDPTDPDPQHRFIQYQKSGCNEKLVKIPGRPPAPPPPSWSPGTPAPAPSLSAPHNF
jgi:hypothetical protein